MLAAKAAQPPKARPDAVNDTAMERRGAQVLRVMENLAPKRCDPQKGASRRSIPSAFPRARKWKAGRPGPLKNRGDDARLLFENRIGCEAASLLSRHRTGRDKKAEGDESRC